MVKKQGSGILDIKDLPVLDLGRMYIVGSD